MSVDLARWCRYSGKCGGNCHNIPFHNTLIHTQLKKDMGIMINQRTKPRRSSLAQRRSVSGTTQMRVRGWAFPLTAFRWKTRWKSEREWSE